MLGVKVTKKAVSLAAVCLQSTLLAIVLNLSSRRGTGQPQYKASSAVIITELVKLALSVALAARELQEGKPAARAGQSVSAIEAVDPHRRQSKTTAIEYDPCPTVTIDGYRRRSTFVAQTSMSVTQSRTPCIEANQSTEKGSTVANPGELHFGIIESGRSFMADLRQVWLKTSSPNLYKMALPAVLFSVQNMLIYVAARNLSMAVFQITFQLKSLVTALCAVVMLGRRYTPLQWLSLLFLGLGVACIQLAPKPGPGHSSEKHGAGWNMTTARPSRSQMLGLMAVIVSCFASAVAATYFELVLKRPDSAAITGPAEETKPVPCGRLSIQLESAVFREGLGKPASDELFCSAGRRHTVASLEPRSLSSELGKQQAPVAAPPSLWIKNIQLALFSLICTTAYNYCTSAGSTREFFTTFFEGFNAFTWAVITIQAVGGLLTALVIKHADNVAKGFALSTSIVLTFAISILCFHYRLTALTAVGATVVLVTAFTFERFGR